MKKLFMMLAALVALSIPAMAQECYNPETGENCGLCSVTGKTCKPSNGQCIYPYCEVCQKIVRTEFCGIFLLAPSCWCFALNSSPEATADCTARNIMANQKHMNLLHMRGVQPNALDRILVALGLQVQREGTRGARHS